MADINERLQKILTERFNDNQSAFANSLGVKQTTVANYFNKRKSAPSLDVLSLMVEKLGIDARWLLTGKEYSLNRVSEGTSTSGASIIDSQVFIGVPTEIRDLVAHYESLIIERERLILEKDKRITELKERIDELKTLKK